MRTDRITVTANDRSFVTTEGSVPHKFFLWASKHTTYGSAWTTRELRAQGTGLGDAHLSNALTKLKNAGLAEFNSAESTWTLFVAPHIPQQGQAREATAPAKVQLFQDDVPPEGPVWSDQGEVPLQEQITKACALYGDDFEARPGREADITRLLSFEAPAGFHVTIKAAWVGTSD